MAKTSQRVIARKNRVRRIRARIFGNSERPRLSVFRSNKHMYAQIIDDSKRITITSISTGDKEFIDRDSMDKVAQSKAIGEKLAFKALSAGIKEVVFDRGGNLYHGRIKALAEGAREGGLVF